jgi:hypothetical protein
MWTTQAKRIACRGIGFAFSRIEDPIEFHQGVPMLKRTIAMLMILVAAAGCEPPPQATPTRTVPPPEEKRSDVKIQAPGVKIDIERKQQR